MAAKPSAGHTQPGPARRSGQAWPALLIVYEAAAMKHFMVEFREGRAGLVGARRGQAGPRGAGRGQATSGIVRVGST